MLTVTDHRVFNSLFISLQKTRKQQLDTLLTIPNHY